MPAVVGVGAQWGDEGKGKVVDILAEHADIVVRYQGGNNAGHTLVVGDRRPSCIRCRPASCTRARSASSATASSSIPSRCSRRSTRCARAAICRTTSLLKISDRAHLIMPYHRAIDQARERLRGEGPHRHHRPRHRSDVRGQDGAHRPALRRLPRRARRSPTRCAPSLEEKNAYLRTMLGEQALDFDAHLRPVQRSCASAWRRTSSTPASILDRALAAGRRVLFEGAQGTMLDVDHGTYPVRDLVEHRRRPPPAPAAASRRAASPASSASPRRTRRASAAVRFRPSCSTTSARSCSTTARSSAPPPAGRAAAAGSTRSSRATRCASTASTAWR